MFNASSSKTKILLFISVVMIIGPKLIASSKKPRQRSVKILGVSTDYGPKFYSNLTAWLDRSNKLNMEMDLIRPLVLGYKSSIDIQLKLARSTKYQNVFSYTFDFCKLMNQSLNRRVLRVWINNFLKYSNLQYCPIKPGHYYVRGLVMEPSSVPTYLSSGDYRIHTYNYVGNRKTIKENLVSDLCFDMRIY